MSDCELASGTRSLRASSGCVAAMPLASANVAWFFETRSVG